MEATIREKIVLEYTCVLPDGMSDKEAESEIEMELFQTLGPVSALLRMAGITVIHLGTDVTLDREEL